MKIDPNLATVDKIKKNQHNVENVHDSHDGIDINNSFNMRGDASPILNSIVKSSLSNRLIEKK